MEFYSNRTKVLNKNMFNQIIIFDFYRQQNFKRANTNCLFHAGLASNCDFRDVISAVNEMNYWGSDMTPGKKKRSKSLY